MIPGLGGRFCEKYLGICDLWLHEKSPTISATVAPSYRMKQQTKFVQGVKQFKIHFLFREQNRNSERGPKFGMQQVLELVLLGKGSKSDDLTEERFVVRILGFPLRRRGDKEWILEIISKNLGKNTWTYDSFAYLLALQRNFAATFNFNVTCTERKNILIEVDSPRDLWKFH